MKLLLILLAILYSTYLSGQVFYDELPVHNSEKVKLLFSSTDGVLIGVLLYSDELLKSTDNGISWQKIEKGLIRPSYHRSRHYKIRIVQKSSDIYLVHQGVKVFIQEDLDRGVSKYVASISGIRDLGFLPNQNLLIATDNEFYLYNKDGTLILKNYYTSDISKLLIGRHDTHYCAHIVNDSIGLTKFDSDLNKLNTELHLSIIPKGQLYFMNGRLFTNKAYSDDGINWTTYPRGISGYLFVHKNGKVSIIRNNAIYVSRDNGESFIKHDISIPFEFEGVYSNGSEGMVFYNNNHPSVGLYYSENGESDWKYIKDEIRIGSPFANKIKVFDKSNIYLMEGNSYNIFRDSEYKDWQIIKPCSEELRDIEIFSDGTAVSSSGCRTENKGLSWSDSKLVTEHPLGIRLKNDNLYIVETNKRIHKSSDKGLTWTLSNCETPNWMCDGEFNHPFDITSDDHILIKGSGLVAPVVVRRANFEGEFIDEYSMGNVGTNGIATSKSGNNIYYNSYSLITGPNAAHFLKICSSFDLGQTVQCEEIQYEADEGGKLLVGHLENLYILNSYYNKLLTSNDGGLSWNDISPLNNESADITDFDIGYDNHIYISTNGTPILRSKDPVQPASTFTSSSHSDKTTRGIKVFPNPASEYISLELGNDMDIYLIELIDSQGKIWKSIKQIYSKRISLKNIPSGLYYLRILYGNNTQQNIPVLINK